MSKVINIYKPIGLTPLQLVDQYKALYPSSDKVSYMGRLDPLAHGVILLLVGDINKQRDQFLSLDKTYKFKVWLGIATDSYDLLGELTQNKWQSPPNNWQELLKNFINQNTGSITQNYPPYSSKPVKGHALFWWAKQGRLNEIDMPHKIVQITSFRLINQSTVDLRSAVKIAINKISLVNGDYRQESSIRKWQELAEVSTDTEVIELELEIECTSGTYVREIVHNLGLFLGCGAVVVEINRTKMGEYLLEDSIYLD